MFTALSNETVSITAHVNDLSASGPALALWEAVRSTDHRGGATIVETYRPATLVRSALPVLTTLLRQGGAHDGSAHREAIGPDPLASMPVLRDDIASFTEGHCECSVTTACTLLRPGVARTLAAPALGQVNDAFAANRKRAALAVSNITLVQTFVLLNAAAFLTAKRRRIDADQIVAETRTRIAAARLAA